MGSVYIMISVPSAAHEKKLWIEKSISSAGRRQIYSTTSMQSNKSSYFFPSHSPTTDKEGEESLEQKKNLWIEKNLNFAARKQIYSTASMQSNKSANIIVASHSPTTDASEEGSLVRSLSVDSVLERAVTGATSEGTNELKERAHSTFISPPSKRVPMEKKLEKCLKDLKIPNAVWILGKAGKFYQVSFCTPAGEKCEQIIQLLTEHEIGVELNSTVSILPCTLYYEGKEHTFSPTKTLSPTLLPTPKDQSYVQGSRHEDKELSTWERFVSSVRARLMVAQVVAEVKSNAVFTFDFLILLIIASLTAAVGLVENSMVILVASMLISPLMGPVMASTFGFVTRDWKLHNIGVLSELLGLLICVLIGFLYGLFFCYFYWESPDLKWPTPEMLTRGDLRSLCVGALIALLAGAAVAIAVLGNYSCSLTGVAISASLMPPAVNAGLLWAAAAVAAIRGETGTITALGEEKPMQELLVLGGLSLFLTFINIVCIFLTGILVLKVKEVTPQSFKDYSRLLWKETFPFTQECQCNLNQADIERMEPTESRNQMRDILSRSQYDMGMNQYTWSAYECMRDLNHRPTAQDLASVFQQLSLRSPHVTASNAERTSRLHRPRCYTTIMPRAPPRQHIGFQQVQNSNDNSSLGSSSILNTAFTEDNSMPKAQSRLARFTITPSNINSLTNPSN